MLEREAPIIWDIHHHIAQLQKLLVPELIGFFQSFEVTEIIGYHGHDKLPVNFLSILVAEPPIPPAECKPTIISGKRLKLAGTQWQFGVVRYRIPCQRVVNALQDYANDKGWIPANQELKVGKLSAVPPQFIPPDGPSPHPWNRVLKNNFWAGSHVLELADGTKDTVKFLLEEPALLKELDSLIRPHVQVGIDGLFDRLGNVLIQLPVTVLSAATYSDERDGAFVIQPVWHPSATARTLRVSCEKYEDTTVEGFDSQNVETEAARFDIRSLGGNARFVLWDDTNDVILAASAKTAFFTTFGWSFNSSVLGGEARTFSTPSKNGELESTWIPVSSATSSYVERAIHVNPREPWRSQRLFNHSLHQLKERKEFVQYGGQSGVTREDAMKDLHWLLMKHGDAGAWLWDPFLDADDILQTLFFNSHSNVDMKALSAGHTIRTSQSKNEGPVSWTTVQRDRLESAKGNGFGLNLEYRVRRGSAGWEFHDRFLIFPAKNSSAIAWSLGTSINSFGRSHHILQKVQDGGLIQQAFLDLWNALDGVDHLVWKTS